MLYDHLEGQWDLVSRLLAPITHIVSLVIPLVNLILKSTIAGLQVQELRLTTCLDNRVQGSGYSHTP